MSIPDPLKILDPTAQTSLHIDADLGATGDGLAIMAGGDGTRLSVEFDLDDVRNLHRWAEGVLRAHETATT
jgi:hypothetical protein